MTYKDFSAAVPMVAVMFVSVICGIGTARGSDAPLEFLANGTLTHLRLDGNDILREVGKGNGFFALVFDGSKVTEIAFEEVKSEGDRLVVTATNGFPKLEFITKAEANSLSVELVRVQGMPMGADVSILFRAGVADSVGVKALGRGGEVERRKGGVWVFWIGLGRPNATAPFGGFMLNHAN